MLKIRLKRAGGRNHPFYRVVVMDSRKARDSRALEEIGYYNPLENPMVFNVNREKVAYWTERGAQITDSVKGLLKRENNTHPTRRHTESFDPEPLEEKAPPKPKKKKIAKAGAKKTKDAAVEAKEAAKTTKDATAATKETADGKKTGETAESAPGKTAEPGQADAAAGGAAKEDGNGAPTGGGSEEVVESVGADAATEAKGEAKAGAKGEAKAGAKTTE